ncbi:MAG: hypothetical protein ACI9VR_000703 [Cognaticolwellia sp.]|jgi:hypothetical protein
MIALLSTLALAQEPPNTAQANAAQANTAQANTALTAAALPAPSQMQSEAVGSTAYVLGHAAGTREGDRVPTADFALYSAGATVLAGAVGCCGVAAAGYMLEPSQMPPRSRDTQADLTVPNAKTQVGIPQAPAGVDPEEWALGYLEGWTEALQANRGRSALVGGGAVAVGYAVVTTIAFVVYVVFVGAIIFGTTALVQEPLTADAS